ncbi:MAG TPA: 23S rRNA (adenine(2503)-C(2))-methyltransferase RlmN, partial [Verrucomicrobiales bacterium]|nr:23S rRNA (adenine(2503)-C(2))-methyltransferase RlmN [Verrucomicrobiales bacterium]
MLTQSQLSERLVEHGQPSYRATQILDWIFKKRAKSWDKMTNLPESLRVDLAEQYP